MRISVKSILIVSLLLLFLSLPIHALSTENPDWQDVERLYNTSRDYSGAENVIDSIIAAAKEKGDRDEWLRGLVRKTQVQLTWRRYQGVLQALKTAEWPQDTVSQITLRLLYLQILRVYRPEYRTESQQKEANLLIGSGFKSWTSDEIDRELVTTISALWELRTAATELPSSRLSEYWMGSFPKSRSTLRGLVAYSIADLESDVQFWQALSANLRYTSKSTSPEKSSPERAVDLVRRLKILRDLEEWLLENNDCDAAAETVIEEVSRSFARKEPSTAIRDLVIDRSVLLKTKACESRLKPFDVAISGLEGSAINLRVTRDKLSEVCDRLSGNDRSFTLSLTSSPCGKILDILKRTELFHDSYFQQMPGKIEMLLRHRNASRVVVTIETLPFSEFVDSFLLGFRGAGELMSQNEPLPGAQKVWQGSFSVKKSDEPTGTRILTSIRRPALYVARVSNSLPVSEGKKGDKKSAKKTEPGIFLLVSRLGLVTTVASNLVTVKVLDQVSGKPLRDAKVHLYGSEYLLGRYRVAKYGITDAQGEVEFEITRDSSLVVVARRGEDIALQPIPQPSLEYLSRQVNQKGVTLRSSDLQTFPLPDRRDEVKQTTVEIFAYLSNYSQNLLFPFPYKFAPREWFPEAAYQIPPWATIYSHISFGDHRFFRTILPGIYDPIIK